MAVFAGPLLLGYAEMARRTGRGLTAIWPELPADAWPVLFAPGPLANLVDLPRLMLLEFGALLALPLLLPRRVADRGGGCRLAVAVDLRRRRAVRLCDVSQHILVQRFRSQDHAVGAGLRGAACLACFLARAGAIRRTLEHLGADRPGRAGSRWA